MEAERFKPARAWDAFDGRCPPHTRPDQGPTGRDIHDLARPHAQYGVHSGLKEEGEMGIRTQATIRHQHIPCL
jgi:hypothetical protein